MNDSRRETTFDSYNAGAETIERFLSQALAKPLEPFSRAAFMLG